MFPLEKNSSPQPQQWLRKCNYLAWLAIFHTEVAVISPCYQPLRLLWVVHRVDSACQRTPSVRWETLCRPLQKHNRKTGKANLLTKQPHLLIERFYHSAALQIAVHFLTIPCKKAAKGNRVDPRQNSHAHVQIHSVASSNSKRFYFRQALGWMGMHPFQAAYIHRLLPVAHLGGHLYLAAPVIHCQTSSNRALEQSERGYASHIADPASSSINYCPYQLCPCCQ